MTAAFLIAWHIVGFVLALICRQALEYGTTYELQYVKPKPVMYRTLIACAFFAPAGPFLIAPAVLWGIMWFFAKPDRPGSGRILRWMNTPVGGRSGEKLQ